MLHLGDKLAHLCPNKDFVFLRASVVPQVCRVQERERERNQPVGGLVFFVAMFAR